MKHPSVLTARFLSTFHPRYLDLLAVSALTLSSGAWPSANLAIGVPFYIPWPFPLQRLIAMSGSAARNNCDVGIYTTSDMCKIVSSGAIAMSGNSLPQFASKQEMIPKGWYMAFQSVDNTTANRMSVSVTPTLDVMRGIGCVQMASAYPLPDRIVPATLTSNTFPFIGLTTTPSGY